MKPVRIAILDMYKGQPNQGLTGILNIVENQLFPVEWKVFEVRNKGELPDTGFDIYISSGGPGNPITNEEIHLTKWLLLMDRLWEYNRKHPAHKKFVFLICHSFQALVHHWNTAPVIRRKSTAYGIFPIHKTRQGMNDPLLKALPDPFYGMDSRNWQIIRPDASVWAQNDFSILCIEKERPHVPFPRAVMGIRFSNEWVGFQFHPEADAFGMKLIFQRPERKQLLVEKYGEAKYQEILRNLRDKEKIDLTHNTIIPTFLRLAVEQLRGVKVPC